MFSGRCSAVKKIGANKSPSKPVLLVAYLQVECETKKFSFLLKLPASCLIKEENLADITTEIIFSTI
jgi:hypothetical protein